MNIWKYAYSCSLTLASAAGPSGTQMTTYICNYLSFIWSRKICITHETWTTPQNTYGHFICPLFVCLRNSFQVHSPTKLIYQCFTVKAKFSRSMLLNFSNTDFILVSLNNSILKKEHWLSFPQKSWKIKKENKKMTISYF